MTKRKEIRTKKDNLAFKIAMFDIYDYAEVECGEHLSFKEVFTKETRYLNRKLGVHRINHIGKKMPARR